MKKQRQSMPSLAYKDIGRPLREEEQYSDIAVASVVEFILRNRGDKVFKGWSAEQIELAIVMGSEQNLFFVYSDEDSGQIQGCCLLRKLKPFEIHINQVICMSDKKLLGLFLKKFIELWPSTKYLTAERDGEPVVYKVDTLKRLLQLEV